MDSDGFRTGGTGTNRTGLLDAILVSAKHYGIVVLDRSGDIKTWNCGAENIFGYTQDEIIGQSMATLFTFRDQRHDVPAQELENARSTGRADDLRWHRRKDGSTFWADGVMTPILDAAGDLSGYVKILRDATEQREAELELERLSRTDPLTELANRAEFDERLKDMSAAALRHGRLLVLQLIDLDHFKRINDKFGHQTGDLVLCEAARRMRGLVRETDLIARLGGDEFVVLQPDAGTPEVGAILARKLIESLSQPYKVEGIEAKIGVSIGISVFPQDDTDRDQLLRKADLALYKVKEGDRSGYHFFTRDLDYKSFKRTRDLEAVRRAARDGLFTVHYQPQVDVHSGEVLAMEALLRCSEPVLADRPVEQVVALAVDAGVMEQISLWLMGVASAQVKRWQVANLPRLKLCVNLCAQEMVDPQLPNKIRTALGNDGLRMDELEVEITESNLFDSGERGLSILERLRSCGATVAIDDFGTGYSSLSYLNNLPVDVVKLDKSFLRDIPGSAQARTVAGAVVNLVRGLDLQIVVEGVETGEQVDFFQQRTRNGAMQGYFFSRPLPGQEMSVWLGERAGRTASGQAGQLN